MVIGFIQYLLVGIIFFCVFTEFVMRASPEGNAMVREALAGPGFVINALMGTLFWPIYLFILAIQFGGIIVLLAIAMMRR